MRRPSRSVTRARESRRPGRRLHRTTSNWRGIRWRILKCGDQMTQPRIGRLIVIYGPSGVGKDTVLRRLFELAPDLKYSVSYTTRPTLPGDVDSHRCTIVGELELPRHIER